MVEKKRLIKSTDKGDLRRFGYSSKKSEIARHRALNKAVKAYGAVNVIQKLNAVCVLNRFRNPTVAIKFCEDKWWVQKNYLK